MNNIELTDIRIHKINKEESVIKAIANVELAHMIVIHGIKLIEKEGKRYLAFPSKKIRHYVGDGNNLSFEYSYTDIVHPSNTEFRKYLQDKLFETYDNGGIVNE